MATNAWMQKTEAERRRDLQAADMVRMAAALHQEKVRKIEEWQKQVDAQYDLSCKACKEPACCMQIVSTHLFEAVLLVNQLMLTGKKETVQRLVDAGMLQLELMRPVLEQMGGDSGYEKLAEAQESATATWFDRREQCPLLNEDKLCSLYELRPTSCAVYCVVTKAELCGAATGQMVAGVEHVDVLGYSLILDAQLLESMGVEEAFYAPLPMGVSINNAFTLLTQGPKALFGENAE